MQNCHFVKNVHVYVFYSLYMAVSICWFISYQCRIYYNWNRKHQYAMPYVCDVDHRKSLKVDGVETTFRNRFMFVLSIKSDILIENATWILSSNARHDAVCFYQLEL